MLAASIPHKAKYWHELKNGSKTPYNCKAKQPNKRFWNVDGVLVKRIVKNFCNV